MDKEIKQLEEDLKRVKNLIVRRFILQILNNKNKIVKEYIKKFGALLKALANK